MGEREPVGSENRRELNAPTERPAEIEKGYRNFTVGHGERPSNDGPAPGQWEKVATKKPPNLRRLVLGVEKRSELRFGLVELRNFVQRGSRCLTDRALSCVAQAADSC